MSRVTLSRGVHDQGAKTNLVKTLSPSVPFKGWVSGSGGVEGSALFRKVLTLVVTYKPWIVKKCLLGQFVDMYRNKSPFEWVPYSVHLLLECFWLVILASQTWYVQPKLVWCSNYSNLAFHRMPDPHPQFPQIGGGADHLQKPEALLATPAEGRRSLALRQWLFHPPVTQARLHHPTFCP